MTTRKAQRKERWTQLLNQIFDPVLAFGADYDARSPSSEDGLVPGRRLHQGYRSEASQHGIDDDEKRKALGLYLKHKRHRWFTLWDEAAGRITACESEHVLSAPNEADWAALAARHVCRRFVHFLRGVQIKHPDMPEIEMRPDGTGRYAWGMSALDELEEIYFDIFEVANNYIERATSESERERRIAARQGVREWIDYRASGGVLLVG